GANRTGNAMSAACRCSFAGRKESIDWRGPTSPQNATCSNNASEGGPGGSGRTASRETAPRDRQGRIVEAEGAAPVTTGIAALLFLMVIVFLTRVFDGGRWNAWATGAARINATAELL